MIKRAQDLGVPIANLLKQGAMDGERCTGIEVFHEHYRCRLKQTTLITGYPSSGKSFFAMNIQAGLTSFHSWKHFLYTPEMGTAEEIYLTIAEILTGVNVGFGMNENILYQILPFIHEHFLVFEPESNPTMESITKDIAKAAEEHGINTFSIDNLNDLRHNIVGTQDIYFEDQLLLFNNCAKNNNLHGFLLAHPAKPQPDDLNHPPTPDKIKGGSAFWSKGQTILSLRDCEENLQVAVYKAKPRYVAKKGDFMLQKEYKRSTYSHYHVGRKVWMFPQAAHQEQQQEAF